MHITSIPSIYVNYMKKLEEQPLEFLKLIHTHEVDNSLQNIFVMI